MALYGKVRIPLEAVCSQMNITVRTAYNWRQERRFPIPMAGNPLTASITDLARYLAQL